MSDVHLNYLKAMRTLHELDLLDSVTDLFAEMLQDCDEVNRVQAGETLFRSQGAAQKLVELLSLANDFKPLLNELLENTQ